MQIEYKFLDDDEFLPDDLYEQIEHIERTSGINILRGKNISCIALDVETDKVAGILYTEMNNYKFSFDIIVAKEYRHKGIGKELIKIGIAEYQQLKFDIEDLQLILDVVNPNLIKYLKKLGFKIINQEKDHTIMKK